MRSASPGPNKGRANPARSRSSLLPPSASVERQLGKHSWDRQKHVRSLGCLQISCCFAWCFVKWGAHFLLDKEMRLFVWRVSRTNCPTLTTHVWKITDLTVCHSICGQEAVIRDAIANSWQSQSCAFAVAVGRHRL